MSSTRILSACIFLALTTLISISIVGPVHGFRSDITLDQESVTMNIGLQLTENITSLPLVNIRLQNPANITGLVENAVKRQVPTATLQGLQLDAKTTLLNSTTKLWLLQENYTMKIVGASSNTGAMISTNVAFLSMNMSDQILVRSENGTLAELNQIGRTYLLQPLKAFPGNPTTAYFFNGARFSNTALPGINTDRFRFLDLTWIPPISQWNRTINLLGSTTKWDLNSQTSSTLFEEGAPFNLTIGLTKRETTYAPVYQALFDPSLELRVQAASWALGTTVNFNIPTWIETLMPLIVIISLALSIITIFVDGRLTKRVQGRKRKG